jgi:N-acyl-D-amino-acid deacylase
MKPGWLILAGFWMALVPIGRAAATFDLILRRGRVIDGAGNPAFSADVAVTEGRIAAVGKINGWAKSELDASGLVIAPGFIDVHTHAEDLAELPLAENFVRMGVTTIVTGNCGGSALHVAEFFRRIERTGVAVNIATLIGHGTVRSKVMGDAETRAPTAEELAEMKWLVDQAMTDGAAGLSTGLIYVPGTFAKTEEIIALAKVAAASDGIYATHMRDEGKEIFAALEEVFRIAREAKIRAEISHLKLSGPPAWGQADKVLAEIDRARAQGLDITHDQYVYTASSTGIGQLLPEQSRETARLREQLASSEGKTTIVAEMKARLRERGRTNFAYALIADYKHDRSLNGLNLVEAAKKRRDADSLDDQIELILEIQLNGGASGVFHGISEDDLQAFLRHPNTMIASDSGVRRFQEGVPHPRGYGNNARVLAHYVRELKLLRLEEAIRRMTGLPANTFHLENRGQLREGNWADIVVFDPGKVEEHGTFGDPHHYATGFAFVLVNGVVVVKDDTHTGARPGQVLRHLAK